MFARIALASFGTTAVAGMGIVAFAAPSSAETTVTVSGSVTEVGVRVGWSNLLAKCCRLVRLSSLT